jgi:hypothetical protein
MTATLDLAPATCRKYDSATLLERFGLATRLVCHWMTNEQGKLVCCWKPEIVPHRPIIVRGTGQPR